MENPNPSTCPNAMESSEVVASIEDLLTEILVRVPIKPLVSFKLVSKQWLSLISDHQFCLRRNPAPNPARGIFLCIKHGGFAMIYRYIRLYPNDNEHDPFMNFEFTKWPASTVILNSCNGLMLCSPKELWKCMKIVGLVGLSTLYVYNPTTKSHATLPDALPSGAPAPHGAVLAFDPVKSPYYKVVLVLSEIDKSTRGMSRTVLRIKVYSSETRAWTDCTVERANELGKVSVNKGVYCNGSVHWLTDKSLSLRFNVDTFVLDDMPTPPLVNEEFYASSYYFGASCGHLHFLESVTDEFNVYEMKSDYSQWFVLYRVNRSLLGLPGYFIVDVISVIRDEEHPTLVLSSRGTFIKHNPVAGTWEFLHDYSWGTAGSSSSDQLEDPMPIGEQGFDYVQSLCSVN